MFDLFRIFGIKIRAEWTVLFLFLIMGQSHVAAIPAIFIVIVTHELGHALMVKNRGGYVESIILQGFGGVTLYQGIHTPAHKALVAVAGPLVNLIIAGILWNLVPLFSSAVESGFLAVLIQYTMFYSFLLGVFNLLPILPLDGGHILESLLSMKYDAHRSRLWALQVTRIGSAGMVLLGLVGNQIFILIFGVLFFFLAHRELSQLTQYSPGASMWQNFQNKREERKEEKKQEMDLAMRARVDQLLAKISREGMSSLTAEERDFLNRASDRFK